MIEKVLHLLLFSEINRNFSVGFSYMTKCFIFNLSIEINKVEPYC